MGRARERTRGADVAPVAVPGDGGLNYADVMAALKGMDYSGWIVIEAEQDPAKADPRTYADLGLRTLKARAAEAGLA